MSESMTKHDHNISFYQTRKRLHRCVRCGNQDARTLIGKPVCFDCLELKREESKRYNYKEVNKNLRMKAEENGKCILCLKRDTDSEHKTCKFCREKQRKRDAAKRLEKGKITNLEAKELGICGICYQRPKMHGYNTCEICYEYIVNKFKGTQGVNRIKNRITKEVNTKEMFQNE